VYISLFYLSKNSSFCIGSLGIILLCLLLHSLHLACQSTISSPISPWLGLLDAVLLTTFSLTCQLQPQHQLPTLLPLQGIPCYSDKMPPRFLHWRILNTVVTVNLFGLQSKAWQDGGKVGSLEGCGVHDIRFRPCELESILLIFMTILHWEFLHIYQPHMIYTPANTLYYMTLLGIYKLLPNIVLISCCCNDAILSAHKSLLKEMSNLWASANFSQYYC